MQAKKNGKEYCIQTLKYKSINITIKTFFKQNATTKTFSFGGKNVEQSAKEPRLI